MRIDNMWWSGNQDRKRWRIQRTEKRICFGNPGYVIEWIDQGSYETEEEAKKELQKLFSFSDPSNRKEYRIYDAGREFWVAK